MAKMFLLLSSACLMVLSSMVHRAIFFSVRKHILWKVSHSTVLSRPVAPFCPHCFVSGLYPFVGLSTKVFPPGEPGSKIRLPSCLSSGFCHSFFTGLPALNLFSSSVPPSIAHHLQTSQCSPRGSASAGFVPSS